MNDDGHITYNYSITIYRGGKFEATYYTMSINEVGSAAFMHTKRGDHVVVYERGRRGILWAADITEGEL